MNVDPRKSEEASKPLLTAMREPPGRLGDIVRRLKQAQPLPSRLIPATGETPAT